SVCAQEKGAQQVTPSNIDNSASVRLSFIMIVKVLLWKGFTVTEHIKMTAAEAKQKAEAIRKVILDTYHQEVKPSPFFSELRAGTLSRKRLQGWIRNWYAFALEVNTGMATSYHQFVGFFKRHPELENRIAQKIGEEFTTPAVGGHARMLPILGKALGVRPEEMIECELIPEARGLVDFFVRSWIDIPLAECYAVHME